MRKAGRGQGPFAGMGTVLLRASLLFGPIAVTFAVAMAMPGGDRDNRYFAMNRIDNLDRMQTGSIGSGNVVALQPVRAGGPGPCLYFPDGSQRGAC